MIMVSLIASGWHYALLNYRTAYLWGNNLLSSISREFDQLDVARQRYFIPVTDWNVWQWSCQLLNRQVFLFWKSQIWSEDSSWVGPVEIATLVLPRLRPGLDVISTTEWWLEAHSIRPQSKQSTNISSFQTPIWSLETPLLFAYLYVLIRIIYLTKKCL